MNLIIIISLLWLNFGQLQAAGCGDRVSINGSERSHALYESQEIWKGQPKSLRQIVQEVPRGFKSRKALFKIRFQDSSGLLGKTVSNVDGFVSCNFFRDHRFPHCIALKDSSRILIFPFGYNLVAGKKRSELGHGIFYSLEKEEVIGGIAGITYWPEEEESLNALVTSAVLLTARLRDPYEYFGKKN